MKRPLIKAIWVLMVLILVLISIPTKQKNNDNEVVFWTLQMNDFAPYMNKLLLLKVFSLFTSHISLTML